MSWGGQQATCNFASFLAMAMPELRPRRHSSTELYLRNFSDQVHELISNISFGHAISLALVLQLFCSNSLSVSGYPMPDSGLRRGLGSRGQLLLRTPLT